MEKMHNEELPDFCSSPDIRAIRQRVRRVWHRAAWECRATHARLYGGKAKERQHLNDLDVDGKVRW